MSDIYRHGDDYRELLAYQLVRQFNTTRESHQSLATMRSLEMVQIPVCLQRKHEVNPGTTHQLTPIVLMSTFFAVFY